jgi:predicted nuclease with TOPRIM domain
MAVDSNFERLEEKLTHLVEVLGQLQRENADLKSRVDSLEVENTQLKEEYQEAVGNREEAKNRIEQILAKLDQVEL